MELSVIYEDNDLLALEKPPGIHSAPNATPSSEATMLDMILEMRPELGRVAGWHPWEPAILHRLDFATSGLLLLAKSNESFAAMREILAAEAVAKTYLAITDKAATAAKLPPYIASYFMRAGKGGSRVKVVYSPKNQSHGRKCSGEIYKSDFALRQKEKEFCEVEVVIRRGFRHQIRAHLAEAGYPIVGDEIYNTNVKPKWAGRLYLHALALDFVNPLSGKKLYLTTKIPWNFAELTAGGE